MRYTVGMDKLAVFVNDPAINHGKRLIKKLPLHFLLENQ
jgi:hypothetical protein